MAGFFCALAGAHAIFLEIALILEPALTAGNGAVRPGGEFLVIVSGPLLKLSFFQEQVASGSRTGHVVKVVFHVVFRDIIGLEQQVHALFALRVRLHGQVSVHNPAQEEGANEVIGRGRYFKALPLGHEVLCCVQVASQRHVTEPAVNLVGAKEGFLPLVAQGRCNGDINNQADATQDNGQEAKAKEIRHPIGQVVFSVRTAVQSVVNQILHRTLLFHFGLKDALVKGQKRNDGAAVTHGFGGFGHHSAVLYIDFSVKAEGPHTGAVHHPLRALEGRNNGNAGVLRSRIHALVYEHVVEGVGIFVGLHQAGEAEAYRPHVVSAFSQAPAQLCAIPLAHDAAFAGFIVSALIYVPLVSQALEGYAVLRHREFSNGHGTQIAHGNVEFRAGAAGLGLPHLGNPGAAVLFQRHPDVYILDFTNCLPLSHKAKRQAYKN